MLQTVQFQWSKSKHLCFIAELCISPVLFLSVINQQCTVSPIVVRSKYTLALSLRPGSARCRCSFEKRRSSQACVIRRWYPNTSHDIRIWCDWSDTQQLSEENVWFMEGNARRLLPWRGELSHEDAFYNYAWKQLDGVWFTRWTRFADAGGEFNKCHFEEQAPRSHPCGLPELERTEVAQRDVKISFGRKDA